MKLTAPDSKVLRLLTVTLLSFTLRVANSEAPQPAPLEAYGNLPVVSQLAISPAGKRIALRKVSDGLDAVVVIDLATGEVVGGVGVEKINPRSVYFADENKLVLFASETTRSPTIRGAWKVSAAFVYDTESNKVRQLLKNYKSLYPAQSGVGRVVGISADRGTVFMPAYTGTSSDSAPYSLIAVNLDSGLGKRIKRGTSDTTDWFVTAEGRPIAEEVYDQKENLHQVYSYISGERVAIYEKRTAIPEISLHGLTVDRRAIYFGAYEDDHVSYFSMSLDDGAISGPMFQRSGSSIEAPISDLNRVIHGVEFSGFKPKYRIATEDVDARISELQRVSGNTSLMLKDWTPDFSSLILYASGGWSSGVWLLSRDGKLTLERIGSSRPQITNEHLVPTQITEYAARDGLTIPALLTISEKAKAAGNAPLVVLPHGGPASHDLFEFDWLAQYIASRGYAVLQPQFRGSDGFGAEFAGKGQGEWGARMLTDVDDGVLKLIADGMIDPARVCIVGASYGGYAALAAGAFSEFDYKCIVSIAGVSDLRQMLADARRQSGSHHWVLDYWERQFGNEEREREELDLKSPVNFADRFRAPVLLIHGKDDIVVPLRQSASMYRALQKQDKAVEFQKLSGEDHYLSGSETRLEALRFVDEFLRENL